MAAPIRAPTNVPTNVKMSEGFKELSEDVGGVWVACFWDDSSVVFGWPDGAADCGELDESFCDIKRFETAVAVPLAFAEKATAKKRRMKPEQDRVCINVSVNRLVCTPVPFVGCQDLLAPIPRKNGETSDN
jgi:hypothetical protein